MKKRIHIFDEWDVVEKLVRPYLKAARFINYHTIATWVCPDFGGTEYECFDFTVPSEDKHFDGKSIRTYLDANGKQVYRRANHIEEDKHFGYVRAVNWVTARWLNHGIPGYWTCEKCGYSTMNEADPARFPEEHLVADDITRERLIPHTTDPVPPLPPLPIGTRYARRHQPGSDQWCVCQISSKHHTESPRADVPWSEQIISVHDTKQEAKRELIRLITKK